MIDPRRRRFALGLAAAAAVAALALALLDPAARPPAESGAAEVGVRVVGPDGGSLYDGTVNLENATAHSALVEAGERGGFEVRTKEYPFGLYVEAVAGVEAEGNAGWLYSVERDGARIEGDRPADRFPLEPGDRVTWRYGTVPGG